MFREVPARRERALTAARRVGAYFALLLWLALCAGCASKYRVLRVFFDGVPDPAAEAAVKEPAGDEVEEGPARPSPPKPEIWKHAPYESGDCSLCHVGGSSQRLRLPPGRLCQSCHSGEGFAGSVVHGPVAGGQCGGCHEPHLSRVPHLLRREGPSLCLHCHSPEAFPRMARHQEDTGGECFECHRPHASDEPHLLR